MAVRKIGVRARVGSVTRYGLLSAYAAVTMVPFVWVLLASLKDATEVYVNSFGLPRNWKFSNYLDAWQSGHFSTFFFNSLVYSLGSLALILLFASMLSYVLAKVRPSKVVLSYFLLGIMIPMQAMIIPAFALMKRMGLLNTVPGLMFAYVGSNLSMSILLITGFMKAVPREILESAMMDGCGPGRAFFWMMLPLVKGGISTAAVLAFMNCWNDFIFAYIFISPMHLKTITQGVMMLKGEYITDFGLLCSGLMLTIVPVFIMYVLFQDQVVKGMSAGAIKG